MHLECIGKLGPVVGATAELVAREVERGERGTVKKRRHEAIQVGVAQTARR